MLCEEQVKITCGIVQTEANKFHFSLDTVKVRTEITGFGPTFKKGCTSQIF